MVSQLRWLLVGFFLLISTIGHANVCGSDLQNFNPTSSNLNFVTVQSSNTLEPCLVNLGLFFDYAINTLTYSQNVGTDSIVGSKVKNSLLQANFSFGIGITSAWDVGLNLPVMLSQEAKDTVGATTFSKSGLEEVRLSTKYRFYGQPSDGIAFIFSLGQNTIADNPFAGKDAGPNAVFEFAADKKFDNVWSGAINLGYKRRLPGSTIAGQPFIPMKDQYLYSFAGGYAFNNLKSKMILEYYSALPAVKQDQDTDKNLNSSEINLGLKHRYSKRSTVHVGAGTKAFASFSAPDFRIYTGVTWLLGPICDLNLDKKDPEFPHIEQPVEHKYADPLPAINHPYDPIPFDELDEPLPEPVEKSTGPGVPDVYRFDVGVLFETNSAVVTKKYRRVLTRFIRKINDQGFNKIVVAGHTDSVGRAEYNKALSARRTRSVKLILQEGVSNLSPDRVETEAWGEEKPIATNDTPEGRSKNRRVEIQVWK